MMSSDNKYVPKESTYKNIPQEKPDSSKQDFFQILYSKMSLKKKEKKHPKKIPLLKTTKPIN